MSDKEMALKAYPEPRQTGLLVAVDLLSVRVPLYFFGQATDRVGEVFHSVARLVRHGLSDVFDQIETGTSTLSDALSLVCTAILVGAGFVFLRRAWRSLAILRPGRLLSVAYDCFSLALAESTDNAMLLTGDRQLRTRAAALGVEVHGVLWISDEIEKAAAMPLADLADALARLEADPLVFLPANEVRRLDAVIAQIIQAHLDQWYFVLDLRDWPRGRARCDRPPSGRTFRTASNPFPAPSWASKRSPGKRR
jgi:hypothetical protein